VRTDTVQVELRPRGGLEAVDLGLAMVRAWWRPLATSWLGIVVPLASIVLIVLREHPWWSVVVLWWLRPLFGRIPLHVLSRRLFGEPAGLRDSFASLPQLARSGLGVSLVAQRLSPSRTFLQPVLQLEGLRGAARRARSAVLAREHVGAAMGLLSVGAHMNGAVLFGLPMIVGILVPGEIAWRLEDVFGPLIGSGEPSRGALLLPVLYLIGISVVEPLMVAGGFALYINRRIFLEGWDIDLAFRRLARRAESRPRVAAALLAAALGLGVTAGSSEAAVCDSSQPESAGGCIESILEDEAFGSREEGSFWVPRDFGDRDAEPAEDGWLADAIATIFELAAWVALVGALLALGIGVARRVEPPRAGPATSDGERPVKLFGLELDAATLPEDLVGSARTLWAEGRRTEAMSLLYRGALIRLLEHHGVAIPESATEYECVSLLRRSDVDPEPVRVFDRLTGAWIGTRYAASPPADEAFDELCQGFDRAFRAAQ